VIGSSTGTHVEGKNGPIHNAVPRQASHNSGSDTHQKPFPTNGPLPRGATIYNPVGERFFNTPSRRRHRRR
jgi:hypothetical protein